MRAAVGRKPFVNHEPSPSSVECCLALLLLRGSMPSSMSRIARSLVRVPSWRTEHAASFLPPICNKLLHKAQLSVMGVGGPNRRTDFHLEAGAEFFWQQRGGMELPIVQQGRRRLVRIQEGDVFLLPPRMPHSPQRDADSFGIVVERERALRELDTLRWYTDFDTCQTVLWEQSFHCADLGRDLVPVVEAFKSSNEFKSGLPSGAPRAPPPTGAVIQDEDSEAPVPFSLLGKPRTRIFFDTSGTHHFFGRHAIFGDTPFGPCATLPVLTKTPRPIVSHLSLAATTPPTPQPTPTPTPPSTPDSPLHPRASCRVCAVARRGQGDSAL